MLPSLKGARKKRTFASLIFCFKIRQTGTWLCIRLSKCTVKQNIRTLCKFQSKDIICEWKVFYLQPTVSLTEMTSLTHNNLLYLSLLWNLLCFIKMLSLHAPSTSIPPGLRVNGAPLSQETQFSGPNLFGFIFCFYLQKWNLSTSTAAIIKNGKFSAFLILT